MYNIINNITDNFQNVARQTRKSEWTDYWLQNAPPELRNKNQRRGYWSALPMENFREDDTFIMGQMGGTGVGR